MTSIVQSCLGIVALLFIAFLFSKHKNQINLRTVLGAFVIQFSLAGFVLYSDVGQKILYSISQGIQHVIDYGNEGIGFLFGNLVNFSVEGVGFVFALKVLPIIIFFSALISVLYHLGVMQFFIKLLGGALQTVLKTSKAESMSATANVFVGQTEAPLVVKPYLSKMTTSELFAVMCGGLASIAGSVMAGYAEMGIPLEYLIAASFMAAPGGLLFAKIIFPETQAIDDKVTELNSDFEDETEKKAANVIDAAALGALSGLQLALNVGAMLLAFIGLIAVINGLLGAFGVLISKIDGVEIENLTLQLILGYVFAPLAWLLGVAWNEATIAGSFLGQKLVTNEFVAYLEFQHYLETDTAVALSDKTKAIIYFALCGFANLSSIAILIGGIGSLIPKRRGEIARLGMLAVLAGTFSNFMSAAMAGLFLSL